MRSTPDYAGVSANEDIGESFIAFMNRDLCPKKLLAFHSVLHIISLAVQDSIKHLPKNWITHIRLLYRYFTRSSKRNHKLNECYIIAIENLDNLSNQFGDLYETYGCQLVYPKMHCATRWMGLHTPCNTAIGS